MKKILIVDDDPDFVDAVSILLDAKGYKVVSASDGEEGFAMAKSEKPDLMFIDVMMPKSDVFELSKNLNTDEATKDIPVVVVTGMKKDMNLSFTLEPDSEVLPVKAVLEKPVKPELLLKTVEENIA